MERGEPEEVDAAAAEGGGGGGVVRGRELGGKKGGEEGDAGEEGRAEVQVVQEVQEVLGVNGVQALFQLPGPDWFHSPQHEDMGVGEAAARGVHLLSNNQHHRIIIYLNNIHCKFFGAMKIFLPSAYYLCIFIPTYNRPSCKISVKSTW